MPRIPGIDWKSNNAIGAGVAVMISLGAIFTAYRSIPYADREQTDAAITELRNELKTQWTAIQQDRDKNEKVHEEMKSEFKAADLLQSKNENELLRDESELRGEFEQSQRKNK